MIRNKFSVLIALVLALSIVLLSSCSVNNSDDTTDAPQKTPMYVQNFHPLSTSGAVLPNDTNTAAKQDFNSVIYYGHYNVQLPKPILSKYDTYQSFNSGVISKLSKSDTTFSVGSSNPDIGNVFDISMLELFDEDYFSEHFVLTLDIQLPSGSAKVSVDKIMSDNDETKIYLSSVILSDLGTCDMVTAHIVLGLSKSDYDAQAKTSVFMNSFPIEIGYGTESIM